MRNEIAIGVTVMVLLGSNLMGCAYVTAEPAPPGSDVRGIRVPTVKPLLVVTGAQVELMTIPNPNREYALRFGSFLAKHKCPSGDFLNRENRLADLGLRGWTRS